MKITRLVCLRRHLGIALCRAHRPVRRRRPPTAARV